MTDKITQVVNPKTGELFDVALPVIPYRTIRDASDYKDGEEYEPDSSMVDLTGFEPLSTVIARCMRTMKSPSGGITQVLDLDALKAEAREPGIYEAEKATTIDEAFDTMDPTDAPGFDFVDGSEIIQAVNDNISAREKDLPTTQQTEQSPSIAQATADDAVDKSDSPAEMFDERQPDKVA